MIFSPPIDIKLTKLRCAGEPRAHPLHFSDDGKFKILQVADLHYSVSEGSCRDVDKSVLPEFLSSLGTDPCNGDTLTRSLLAHTLAEEKPSLVVFTGDQLNGQTTSWDAQSVMLKAISEVVDAKIPWAIVFGNHDDENTDLSRSEQMRLFTRMPYAVREMEEGPSWVDGVGNWLVEVKSADTYVPCCPFFLSSWTDICINVAQQLIF